MILKSLKQPTNQAGFTLIEMIVVVGIFGLISSVVLTSNAVFGSNILLRNLAYDIALSIRESQTYGISVRQFSDNSFTSSYGTHISLSSPTTYVLFADTDSNGVYTDASEIVTSYTMGRGFTLSQICSTPLSGSETCTSDPGASVDILFTRPEPDAAIRRNGNGATLYQRSRLIVSSPRGDERSVLIEATGQISVQ